MQTTAPPTAPPAHGTPGTDLLELQPSMLVLYRPVLRKHVVELLDDFRAMEGRESMRPAPHGQGRSSCVGSGTESGPQGPRRTRVPSLSLLVHTRPGGQGHCPPASQDPASRGQHCHTELQEQGSAWGGSACGQQGRRPLQGPEGEKSILLFP